MRRHFAQRCTQLRRPRLVPIFLRKHSRGFSMVELEQSAEPLATSTGARTTPQTTLLRTGATTASSWMSFSWPSACQNPWSSPFVSWGGPRRTARYHGDLVRSNFGTGRGLSIVSCQLTVKPKKQKSKSVGLAPLPGTTRLIFVMGVPDVNLLPLPSQQAVLRLENGIVFVLGVADGGSM